MRNEIWNTLALVIGVIAIAAFGPWLWREVRDLPGRRALAARANERIVTLDVGGMTCAGCAAKVQGELASVPGVSAVQVRLGQDRAYVVCARGLADSVLVSAVSHAGPNFGASVLGE
jgi:copper chaperone CopZ